MFQGKDFDHLLRVQKPWQQSDRNRSLEQGLDDGKTQISTNE